MKCAIKWILLVSCCALIGLSVGRIAAGLSPELLGVHVGCIAINALSAFIAARTP